VANHIRDIEQTTNDKPTSRTSPLTGNYSNVLLVGVKPILNLMTNDKQGLEGRIWIASKAMLHNLVLKWFGVVCVLSDIPDHVI
jgi:hypothetical protein